MRLALDTNRYRDLTQGVDDVVQTLERAQFVGVPFVVLAELRAGFRCGKRGKANEDACRRFLDKPSVQVMYADERTIDHYAAV